jgi:hypothetical protein
VEQVGIVGAFKEENKSNKTVFNHLAAVSEGLSALGWLGVVSLFLSFEILKKYLK